MSAITWDPKVFQSLNFGGKMQLDCVRQGDRDVVTTVNSRPSDLSRVVSVVKTLLEKPLPIKGSKLEVLSQKGCLYFNLLGLEREVVQYNEEVDASSWITAVHVLLAIFTLGIFSFRKTMKVEEILLQLAQQQVELGVKSSKDLPNLVETILPATLVKWSVEEIEAFCNEGVNIDGVEKILLPQISALDASVVKAMVEKPFFFKNMPGLVAQIFQERSEALLTGSDEPASVFRNFVVKRCNLNIDPKDAANKELSEAKFYAVLTVEQKKVYDACRFITALLLTAGAGLVAQGPYRLPVEEDLYN